MRISEFSLVPSCLVIGTVLGIDTYICLGWIGKESDLAGKRVRLALGVGKRRDCVG